MNWLYSVGCRKIWKQDGKLNNMFSDRKLSSKNVCVCARSCLRVRGVGYIGLDIGLSCWWLRVWDRQFYLDNCVDRACSMHGLPALQATQFHFQPNASPAGKI